MPRKSPPNRPEKRNLVRWSDDLDKQVLLTIQYACTDAGVRIPWDKVADLMGEKFTEGAIVQHLAKLRQKMVANNMAVPPPLKRGSVAVAPSKLYAPAGSKRKAPVPAAETPAVQAPTTERSRKPKGKKARDESEEEESDIDIKLDGTDDSDGEYGAPVSHKKRRVSSKKAKKSIEQTVKKEAEDDQVRNKAPRAQAGSVKDDGMESEGTEHGTDTSGPAARTRGVVQDYSNLGGASDSNDDNEEEDELEPEDENEAEAGEPVRPTIDSDGDVSPHTRITSPGPSPGSLIGTSNSLPTRTIAPILTNLTPSYTSSFSPGQQPFFNLNPYLPGSTSFSTQYLTTPNTPSFATDRTTSTASLPSFKLGPSTPTGTSSSTFNSYTLPHGLGDLGSTNLPELNGIFDQGFEPPYGGDMSNLEDWKF